MDRINDRAAKGLAGEYDSLGYRVAEIERHAHSYERWLETAAVASGETHVADSIGDGSGAFTIDAGNDTWGAWVQVLGSSDTPVTAGSAYYDLHHLNITAAERDEVYFMQIGFADSGADALTAGTYTEDVFKPASNLVDAGPVEIMSRRHAVGTKVWIRCMCPGQNTATMNLFIGIHEYEG